MYLISFFLAFFLSILLTFATAILMRKWGIVDKKKKEKRKIHKRTVPLGGGLAIFVTFFVVIAFVLNNGDFFQVDVVPRNLLGIFVGGLIIMIGGLIDDAKNLKARYQIIFPILAVLAVIAFGIGPHEISNPFGGTFDLARWQIHMGILGNFVVLADALVFVWLMGMMFTTKFLDGMDGLVSGVISIGAVIIFFLAREPQWYQPDVAVLALTFAGACLGFLVWNFYPAKIFLGEGGSLFTGFILGVLAIVAGSKIAITLLVMGVPVLDVGRVIYRRWKKKTPIYQGDNEHLHFQLLASGLTQRQTVYLFYTIALLFGVSALFLQTHQKLIALLFLFMLMLSLGVVFSKKK